MELFCKRIAGDYYRISRQWMTGSFGLRIRELTDSEEDYRIYRAVRSTILSLNELAAVSVEGASDAARGRLADYTSDWWHQGKVNFTVAVEVGGMNRGIVLAGIDPLNGPSIYQAVMHPDTETLAKRFVEAVKADLDVDYILGD
jgi:hypothetical protein